uniref:Uncharacterized protein n=1 Tax=Arundo donax TaxID=35708 RepID=A0A0A8Z4B5_ARUDO
MGGNSRFCVAQCISVFADDSSTEDGGYCDFDMPEQLCYLL